MNDEPRDHLHEAFLIAGGQSILMPQVEHIKAVIALLEEVLNEATKQIISK